MQTLLITAEDVQQIVQRVGLDHLMDILIARLEAAFREYDTSRVEIPVRGGFSYTTPVPGLVEWMPCLYRGEDVTIKVVGYHPSNPERVALPTIISTVSAYDSRSGHLKCVMDATLMTALRTGAASAVATRLLAKDGASTLGLIGTGMQAVTQLHAIGRIIDLERVLIYDTNSEIQSSFAERAHRVSSGLIIEAASLDEIALQADIVCTATSVTPGAGPVFGMQELRSGVHINAVGSDFPGKVELGKQVVERAVVIPDFREQAILEGECQQLPSDQIGPELHELVKEPSMAENMRRHATVFDSTGWALEDHVCLQLFVEYADEFDLGRRISIEAISADPHSPYQFLEAAVSKSALLQSL